MKVAFLSLWPGLWVVALALTVQASEPLTVDPARSTTAPPASVPNKVEPVVVPEMLPTGILAFADGEEKSAIVTSQEMEAHMAFWVTNVSSSELTVYSATASCGCTTARIPSSPWTLVPGGSGRIDVTMNTQGKKGRVGKSVTLKTDRGLKFLQVNVTIVETAATEAGITRERNQLLARANRQGVFKGDCASCHVAPAAGKHGRELYTAACAICHESSHRAAMVPDLAARTAMPDEYWRQWITHGREGSMMPAFAVAEGGPLTERQIDSLVTFLGQSGHQKASASR